MTQMQVPDSKSFWASSVIREVVKRKDSSMSLKKIGDTFNQLESLLDAFKPHVLENTVQEILVSRERKTFNIDYAGMYKNKIQVHWKPELESEMFSGDLVLIKPDSACIKTTEVRQLLRSPFAFALVSRLGTRTVCNLEIIESGHSQQLDDYEALYALKSMSSITVFLTSFFRVYKSLVRMDLHQKSPLMEVLLKNGIEGIYNPNEPNCVSFLSEDPEYLALNDSQKEVANHVIFAMDTESDLTLVQGPPGTGKTQILCVMLHNMYLKLDGSSTIVVCAPSNAAVARCANNFVEVYCGPNGEFDMEQFAILGRDDKTIKGQMLSARTRGRYYGNNELDYNKWDKVKHKMSLIFCTVSCIMSLRMEGVVFRHVFCDEAGQVEESHALMLVQNNVKQLVMIGDPFQLPAFSQIKNAHVLNSSRSMFERFWDLRHSCSAMLDTQYRMHPLIAKMVSESTYDGKLQNGSNVYLHSFDFDYPYKTMELIDVDGEECNMNPSFINKQEAEQVVRVIANYVPPPHLL